MEYRKLGKSDLELSVITFGAWAAGGWMWGGTERRDAIEAIRASCELGVTSIEYRTHLWTGRKRRDCGRGHQRIATG
ncbi:MAG: hypothetical protein QM781_06920 [Chitinophagaceae bacterium]